uniref:Uncharacterized protein n=1 Tax=Arundo donax TaxID=35708 RepID=A0A0A9H2T1_ARUDO
MHISQMHRLLNHNLQLTTMIYNLAYEDVPCKINRRFEQNRR